MRPFLLRLALVCGTIVALVALFLLGENLRGRWQLHIELSELASRGASLDPSRLAPHPSKESIEDGAALKRLGEEFATSIRTSPILEAGPVVMALDFHGGARAISRLPAPELSDPRRKPSSVSWDLLSAEIERNAPNLHEAVALLSRPIAFDIDYSDLKSRHAIRCNPFGIVAFLEADILLRLHRGERDESLNDLVAMEKLGAACSSSLTLVDQALAASIHTRACRLAWEALQTGGWTDAQLATMQQAFAHNSGFGDFTLATAMERACLTSLFRDLRSSSQGRTAILRMMQMDFMGGLFLAIEGREDNQPEPSAILIWLHSQSWWLAWSRQDEAHAIGIWTSNLALIHDVRKQGFATIPPPAATDATAKPGMQPLRWRHLFSDLLFTPDVFHQSLRNAVVAETAQRLAFTAFALARYRLAHGIYPARLADLPPALVYNVPLDLMDARPLRYRPTEAGGYLLYSVGLNGTDDHGSAEKTAKDKRVDWTKTPDIVWPVPLQEISNAPSPP